MNHGNTNKINSEHIKEHNANLPKSHQTSLFQFHHTNVIQTPDKDKNSLEPAQFVFIMKNVQPLFWML